MSSKCKRSRKVLMSILAIIVVSLWIFPVNVHARENEKNKKSKKEIPGEIKNVPKNEKDKRKRLDETRKGLLNRGKLSGEENEKKLPGEIKKSPGKEKSKKKTPDEIEKIPGTEKTKKEIPDEIIKISKLGKAAKEFSITRDIFSPDLMRPVDPGSGRKQFTPPPSLPVVKRDLPSVDPKAGIEEEVQGLSYEGYVIKNSKNCALVSMNGEFHAVTIGDIILEKIKIIKIDKKTITVEVESHEFEIQIKEDEENEIQ